VICRAIVDAAFLRRDERLQFRQLAAANAARFVIMDCTAAPAELRKRIRARARAGRDASEGDLAVLEHQLATHEPLDPAERRSAITVDTESEVRYARLAARIRAA
jgi:predicted kinase